MNSLLYRAGKLYVPPRRRETLFRQAHNLPRGGHGGVQVTLAKLQAVWWPATHRDVDRHVSSCLECQARKVENQLCPSGQYRPFETSAPLQLVSVDTLGPIPRSIQGYLYVVVLVDVFTRFVDARVLWVMDDRGFECDLFLRVLRAVWTTRAACLGQWTSVC